MLDLPESESEVAQSCLQSRPTLCDPMDYSPLDFPVHGILQARILKWVAIFKPVSPALAGRFLTTRPPGKPQRLNDSIYKMPVTMHGTY